MLWNRTTQSSSWIQYEVDLPADTKDDFHFIFHVEYEKDCANSVGLDEIEFHRCPVGEFVLCNSEMAF